MRVGVNGEHLLVRSTWADQNRAQWPEEPVTLEAEPLRSRSMEPRMAERRVDLELEVGDFAQDQVNGSQQTGRKSWVLVDDDGAADCSSKSTMRRTN